MLFKSQAFFFIYFLLTAYSIFSHSNRGNFLIRQTLNENSKISNSIKNEFMYSKGFYSKENSNLNKIYFPQNNYSKTKLNQKGISYLPNPNIHFLYDKQILENKTNLLSHKNKEINFYSINSKKEIHKYGFTIFDRRKSVDFQFIIRNYQIKNNLYGNFFFNSPSLFYGQHILSGIVPGFIMDWKVSSGFTIRYKSERLELKGKKESLERFSYQNKQENIYSIGYNRGDIKSKGKIEEVSFIFHFSKNFQIFISPYLREATKEKSNTYPFLNSDLSPEDKVFRSLFNQQNFENKMLSMHIYAQIAF